MCSKKVSYPTAGAAWFALDRVAAKMQHQGKTPPRGIHWCTEHQRWHLTSQRGMGVRKPTG